MQQDREDEMVNEKYRVGIIGLGRMGSTIDDEGHTKYPYSIAAATNASTHLELVAGADIIKEKRTAFVERWGIGAVYQDYCKMIEVEKPDLVAVCTAACLPKPANCSPGPNHRDDEHADLTIALAELDVPMLYVEKAMASSMKRADEVLEAITRSGAQFNTGVLRRFDDRYSMVREAVSAGLIGQIRSVVHYAPSTLMHGHIHSIDTISFLIGDPPIEAVRGDLLPHDTVFSGRHIDHDPRAIYQLRFAGNIEGYTIPAGKWEFEVLGSEGCIRLLNNGSLAVLRRDNGKDSWQEEPLKSVSPKSPVIRCLEDLVQSRVTGQDTRGNVQLTHHITEACIGVAESHLEGGIWIELPLPARDLYIFLV